MTDPEKFILNIIKQTLSADAEQIITALMDYYNVVKTVAKQMYDVNKPVIDKSVVGDNKFNIEYVLAKKIKKHPGIDIKIRGQEGKYKIFVLGAKSIEQLTLIHRFMMNMLRLFKLRKGLAANTEDFPYFSAQPEGGIMIINKTKDISQAVQKAQLIKQAETETEIETDISISDEFAQFMKQESEQIIPEEATPADQPKPPKPKTVVPEKDYTRGISKLDMLKSKDAELFENNKIYAVTCQPVARQPIAVNIEKYQHIIKQLEAQKKSLVGAKTKAERAQLAEINHKIEIYHNGMNYRENRYICPDVYEYMSETIPDKADITEDGRYKDTDRVVYQNLDNEFIYAGVTAKRSMKKDADGEMKKFCLPCCFKTAGKSMPSDCTDELESTTTSTSGQGYIFNNTKRSLGPDRYAMLPEVINIIFNAGLTIDSKLGSSINAYVRKGVNPDVNNIFLNAIGDIYLNASDQSNTPKNGQMLRKILCHKNRITLSKFLSMKSGMLKLVFQDDINSTDEQAFENFKHFLSGNNHVDEDLLWDYVTAPGVITPTGFNLFILEGMDIPNDSDQKKSGNHSVILH